MNFAERKLLDYCVKEEIKEKNKWLSGKKNTYWMWNCLREALQNWYKKSGRGI